MKTFISGLVIALLASLASLTIPVGAAPVYYSPTPISSDLVNGVGYATVVVGNVVYVGGSFTVVTSPSGQTIASRANLAAFDLLTGRLITSFRADTNGMVRALVSDGSSLYVGGSFTTIGGVSRSRLAKVNLTTGAVDTGFSANANSHVYSLAIGGGRLAVAGSFSTIGGQARARVAVVSPASGALQPFNASVDASVNAVAIQPDGSRLYIGGNFTSVNGEARTRLVALDAASGALSTPTFSNVSGHAISLDITPNGRFLGAALAGAGNQGAWFDLTTGSRRWRQTCDGDAQAVTIVGDSLFTGFHESCEGNTDLRLTGNNSLTNGGRDTEFNPTFDRYWGVRGLDGTTSGLVAAGDFTLVSGVPARGFVIFPPRGTTTDTVVGQFGLGSTWAYLDDGSDQGSAWNAPGFDDSSWSRGPGELGYGDGDETTVVSFGPDANQKHMTTYFRRTVEMSAAPTRVDLGIIADDGAVVYVNGVEAARDNMPEGTITATTRSTTERSGSVESTLRSFALDPTLFVAGTNTVAVEVHQSYRTSSDLSFDALLDAFVPAGTTTTTSTSSTTTTSTTSSTTTSSTTTTSTTSSTTTTTAPPAPGGNFPLGSSWSYLAAPAAPAATWSSLDFDSGAWPTGNAQLGYGDGDEATVVPFGPDARNKWPTTYFRRAFSLSSIPTSASVSLVADDGAVVYVNGVEVARDNMPAGTIGYTTLAAGGRWNDAESAVRVFVVPTSALRVGNNVVAVEVHQDSANSSDLSFDAAFTAA